MDKCLPQHLQRLSKDKTNAIKQLMKTTQGKTISESYKTSQL